MTFEEWFEERFKPVDFHMALVRESYREIAREAWEIAFQAGQDHQRELDRLAEYDRSVFGIDSYSEDW